MSGRRPERLRQPTGMKLSARSAAVAMLLSTSLFPACGGGDDDEAQQGSQPPPACSLTDPATCKTGVCEEVAGGANACFAPVTVKGKVVRAADGTGIADARVVARDDAGSAVSSVAITAADGTYSLRVPAKRGADGKPVSSLRTLRADAKGFASFPGGVRPALPFDLATAADAGMGPVVESALTTVSLLALPQGTATGTVKGTVEPKEARGALVVAHGATGIADADGSFVVFNVPVGPTEVRGYAAGVQLAPAQIDLAADQTAEVTLTAGAGTPGTVSGSVNLVNAPGGAMTSVVLVVEDTFVAALEVGEVPRGLRANGVSGAFSIPGVPDGKYVVLASLDNDGLVRDPDTNIAGTQIVHLTVTNGQPSTSSLSFKVTGALAVGGPGANGLETVQGTPTLRFATDPGAETYQIILFDAFGSSPWQKTGLTAGKGGAKEVSVPYDGPALVPGMIYQFRGTSISKQGVPLARTEELRGVFSVGGK